MIGLHPFQIAYREARAEVEAWCAAHPDLAPRLRYPGFIITVFEQRDVIRAWERA